jgi:hypothetical protein
VLWHTEDVELLIFFVPIGSYPFETTGSVVEGVGHYAYLGFFDRHEIPSKKGVFGHFPLPF